VGAGLAHEPVPPLPGGGTEEMLNSGILVFSYELVIRFVTVALIPEPGAHPTTMSYIQQQC
jgi:hypothetical protein